MVMSGDVGDREKKKFIDIGLDKTAVRVNDSTVSSNKLTVSGESITFSGGAAGTTGTVGLDKAPLFNADGTNIGDSNDTSFAWVTGTILTTEVVYSTAAKDTDTLQLIALSNGEFAINYDTGKVLYKKATSGTTDTCNYTSRQLNIEITGSSTNVTPNINLNQVAGSSTNVNGGVRDSATQTVTLADDDPAVAALEKIALTTEATLTQLTAPGNSDSTEVLNNSLHTFVVIVAAIQTRVTVRTEGSLDNTNWVNMDDAEMDITYTANGTYLIHKGPFKTKHVRFVFVSEVGGTAVTLDVKYLGGN